MSNRQARIARKKDQREGKDAFVHIKPTKRELSPVPVFPGEPRGNLVQQKSRLGRNEIKRRERRYGKDE